jgi:hypothetical protein
MSPTPTLSTAEQTRSRRFLTLSQLAAALIILGLLARTMRYLLNFPIWGDEAFLAVNFILRDFRGLLEPLVYGQIAPLGFMWTELAVTRLAGLSEWALRLVPYVSGLVVLLLFRRFVARNFGAPVALLAVGFLAAAYYPIRHAVEVKPYSTDLLVGLIIIMAGWGVYQRANSPPRWGALILLSGLSVWCSYPAIFVAGAVALLLTYRLVRSPTRPIVAGWVIYGVVLGSSFLAMYWLYAKPHAQAVPELSEINMWTKTFPPIAQPWKLPLWLVLVHTGNMLAYPIGGKNGGSIVTLVLVIIGSVVLWRSRKALLLLLLGPLPFNFIASALHLYPYGGSARTSLFMAPAFCLLAAIGLFATFKKVVPPVLRLRAVRTAAVVLGLIAVSCMVRDLLEPYKKPETRESRLALRWLARQVEANDQVVAFLAHREVDHAPYIREARGAGAQLAFYLMRQFPDRLQWAPAAEEIRPTSHGRTWLVVFQREKKGKALFSAGQLEAYLDIMVQRLGPMDQQVFALKETKKDRQTMTVYWFEGPPAETRDPSSPSPSGPARASAARSSP